MLSGCWASSIPWQHNMRKGCKLSIIPAHPTRNRIARSLLIVLFLLQSNYLPRAIDIGGVIYPPIRGYPRSLRSTFLTPTSTRFLPHQHSQSFHAIPHRATAIPRIATPGTVKQLWNRKVPSWHGITVATCERIIVYYRYGEGVLIIDRFTRCGSRKVLHRQ